MKCDGLISSCSCPRNPHKKQAMKKEEEELIVPRDVRLKLYDALADIKKLLKACKVKTFLSNVESEEAFPLVSFKSEI